MSTSTHELRGEGRHTAAVAAAATTGTLNECVYPQARMDELTDVRMDGHLYS